MLILHPSIYSAERSIVLTSVGQRFCPHLPYVRMGFQTLPPSTRPDMWGFRPYCVVLGYADVARTCQLRHTHRVLYCSVAAYPRLLDCLEDDGSDNLIVPDSFKVCEPITVAPSTFGISDSSPLSTLRNEWIGFLKQWRTAWDHHYRKLGLPLATTSVERWGVTYDAPTY